MSYDEDGPAQFWMSYELGVMTEGEPTRSYEFVTLEELAGAYCHYVDHHPECVVVVQAVERRTFTDVEAEVFGGLLEAADEANEREAAAARAPQVDDEVRRRALGEER